MSKKFKIGIDYGGTKIEGILLDDNGLQIERKRYSYEKNYLSGIETVKKLVGEFDKLSSQICTVGLGIPGFSSKESGLVINANSMWLNDKPFKKDLEIALNRKVKLMNDANCFTLSEAVDGAGKDYQSIFGIIVGTGFGGALSYKKEIIEGANQIAGDWGHQPLPYPTKEEIETKINCPSMNCGRPLCAEQFMSGIGFKDVFNQKNNTNFSSFCIIEDKENRCNYIKMALKLLSLPMHVGNHSESKEEILMGIGKFGPYALCDKKFYSIKGKMLHEVAFDDVIEIVKNGKK